MPAVKYDYGYDNRYGKNGKGLAKNARSYQSSSSASRKVSSVSTTRKSTTPELTRNSTRLATSSVSSVSNKKTSQTRKKAKYDIDIPVIVKKKVEIQKPTEMKLTKPKIKAKSKAKAKVEGTKRKILLGTVIISTLFMICMRYTQINEKFNAVGSLEKDLGATIALNQQLSTEIESKTDLSYIEKYAKYQLGMQKPSEKQIVRIAYEKHDKISTPVVIEESIEEDFWGDLLKDLKNLID